MPFKPNLTGDLDLRNFDKIFTDEPVLETIMV